MARLEAVQKGLYYPTQDRILELIPKSVKLRKQDWGAPDAKPVLLDPCCGDGTAAERLAAAWGADAYGVELHQERAAAASGRLVKCWQGSFHQLRIRRFKDDTKEPQKPVAILFLNPPYDADFREGGKARRQEVETLRTLLPLMPEGAVLVLVVPAPVLPREDFQDLMMKNFWSVQAWKYPEPEAGEFNQVVVVGRYCGRGWGYSRHAIFDHPEKLPVLGTGLAFEAAVPVVAEPRFAMRKIVPEEIVPNITGAPSGAWASALWKAQTGDPSTAELSPLMQPRPGHQAMLLAAGALDGLELEGRLVKGGSVKTTIIRSTDDATIERERISSYLSVIDLADGGLTSWKVDEEQAKTAEWFEKHGPALARAILTSHEPQYNSEMAATLDLSGLTAPGILPGKTTPEILPIQREAAGALAHRWERHKGVILCGEMGTGKTTIGTLTCELYGYPRNIIQCPTHLTKKWVREINTITGRKCASVGKTLADVDAFFKVRARKPRYLIISKETAKLGARWRVSTVVRDRIMIDHKTEWEIPPGGAFEVPVKKTVRTKVKIHHCPDCGEPAKLDSRRRCRCTECGAAMWQACPISEKGTKRWPLATYIKNRYPGQYVLVPDECHQYAKAESDQAIAQRRLQAKAVRVLLMTGTIYQGRASSIFYLLYQTDPAFRRLYRYDDVATFVAHYGLFETTYDEEETTSTYGYAKGKGGRIKEIPGMHPRMVQILLPYTVFVKLRDLRLDLPPYKEEVHLVTPDEQVETAASIMASECRKVLKQYPRCLGAYLQACLGYPDRADQEERIISPENDREPETLIATAPAINDATYPKDDFVVDLCVSEHKQGRGVLVFCTQTKRRDARMRLKARLEAEGLRVAVLDGSVPPERREEWLRKQQAVGIDVMLTNGRLVETGMDLLFAHTIVQYGTEYSLATLRQSIRRSWRLGQTKPIRVIFLAYSGTMQATALDLISKKMRAAELVDGDESGGLAQHDSDGGNMLLEIAHRVLEDEEDYAAGW